MISLGNIEALRRWRSESTGRPIGFVPTMGALHDGHLELVKKAVAENERTVVSLFVNPTQFNDPADFEAYPDTLNADLGLCEAAGVDAVFIPDRHMLYPDGYTYRVREVGKSDILEGESRPGHFEGVLTVVLKLCLLVKADKAYFGEKDWQQLQLVKGMARAFYLETEIVGVPTVRAEDGLALSSRNVRLTSEERILAPEFYRVLTTAADCAMARLELESLGFMVEYVDEREGRRLGAVQLGQTRLIDNVPSPVA